VIGDADELRRLARNLVENATRHARSLVRLSLASDEARVRLDVVDDGPGIATGDLERVFDRFTRIDTARSRSTGTGLGLSIARTIAARHGGTLVALETDHGAHFVLELPPVSRAAPQR
jgi:signal transduction histidine kinase